jgi:hypothetical protein
MKSSKRYFLRFPNAPLGATNLKDLIKGLLAAKGLVDSFARWKNCEISLFPEALEPGSTRMAFHLETTYSTPDTLFPEMEDALSDIQKVPREFREKLREVRRKTFDLGGIEFCEEQKDGKVSNVVDFSSGRKIDLEPQVIKSWSQVQGFAVSLDLEKREIKIRDLWTHLLVKVGFTKGPIFQELIKQIGQKYEDHRIGLVVTGEIEWNEASLGIEKVTAHEVEILPEFTTGADFLERFKGKIPELNEQGAEAFLSALRHGQ